MGYFKAIGSLDDLKEQYRKLAMRHHPDCGGDLEAMKAVNAEYDVLYSVWSRRENASNPTSPVTTSPAQSRSEFYTEMGWKGENFNWSLTTKEITARIRSYVKQAYPSWRFSVSFESFAGGSSITVALVQAPAEVIDREALSRLCAETPEWSPRRERVDRWMRHAACEDGFCEDVNQYRLEETLKPYLTRRAYEVISDVDRFIRSYWFDDSDSMIDYFHTNFYYHLQIGKWNRKLKVVPKEDRVVVTSMVQAA